MSTTRTDRIGKTSNLLVIQRSIATKSGDKKGKWLQVEQELHINNEVSLACSAFLQPFRMLTPNSCSENSPTLSSPSLLTSKQGFPEGHFVAITTILDGGARVYDDDVVKSHKNVNQALAAYKCQPYLLFYKRKKKASRVTIDISSSSDLDLDLALPFANSFSEIEFLDTTGPTSKDALETTNDILRMEVQEHKVEKMVDLADADAVEEGDKVHKNQVSWLWTIDTPSI